MDRVTVFVVDDGDRAAGVRSLVESWTRAGLLQPSVWVTPSRITDQPAGPPIVRASVLLNDRTEEVDLFEHIGRMRLDLVRIVVGHLVVAGTESAPAPLVTAGRRVADAVAAVLPRRADVTTGEGCRLHRSVVVVPASGAGGATADLLQPEWDANVVVSPEDRADVDRASVFVRHPGNFDGHAAMALTALGGVVVGVEAGAIDDLTTDATSRDGDASLVRMSVRAIVGEDVLDRVTSCALGLDGLAPHGPSQVVNWARPASRPDLVSESAAAHVIAQEAWAPEARTGTYRPERRHEGLLAAIRTAVVFNVKTVGAVTSWALSRGRARVERSATEAIVGGRSGVLVTLGPRPVDDLARASDRLLERERSRIDEAMRLEATRTYAPPPSTWTDLRGMAFGLVDGGELGDFPEPRQAGRRELLPADAVVVPPGEVWPARGGGRVRAEDPVTMRHYRDRVSAEYAEAEAERLSAQAALEAAEAERGEAEKQPKKARSDQRKATKRSRADASQAAAEPAPKTEQSVSGRGPDETPDDQTIATLRAEAARWEEIAAELHAEKLAYGEWFTTHEASMLWKVADHVGQRAQAMSEIQAKLEKRLARRMTAPSNALKRSQSALRRWWIGTFAFWLLGVAIAAYGHLHGETGSPVLNEIRFSGEEMWQGIEVLSVIAMVLLGRANHQFYKAVRHYEWRVEQLLAQLGCDKAEYVYAGHERTRFELLYEALADWSRIIGETVHRPWSAVSSRSSDVPDELVETMPAAMAVARQSADFQAVPADVVAAAMNVVYQPGWCSRLFEVAYEAWEGEQFTGDDEGHRTVDLDALDSPISPRRRLREQWTSGAAQRVLTRRAQLVLLDAVREGDLLLPERVVSRVGRYSDGLTCTEREFLHATATESTTFSTDPFSASAQQMRRHYVEQSVAWVPAAARVDGSSQLVDVRPVVGSTAVRLDVSPRVPVTDLRPFDVDTDAGLPLDGLFDEVDALGAWH